MEKDANEILKQALSLPPEERVALADSLFDSLDTDVDRESAEMWREEVWKRISELDSGVVRPVAWPEINARLRGRIKR